MAMFDYKCDDCDYLLQDVFVKSASEGYVECPKCKKPMRPVFGVAAVHMKEGNCGTAKNGYSSTRPKYDYGKAPSLKSMGLKK